MANKCKSTEYSVNLKGKMVKSVKYRGRPKIQTISKRLDKNGIDWNIITIEYNSHKITIN